MAGTLLTLRLQTQAAATETRMVRRVTPSQYWSMVRQAEQRQRQAISNYNSAVRRYNADVRRAVNEYNREVNAHNARVRANRQRLQSELSRMSAVSVSTRVITYRTSVVTLQSSLRQAAGADWGDDRLFDLAEGEAANSVATLNVLDGRGAVGDVGDGDLRENVIASEIERFQRRCRRSVGRCVVCP